MQQSFKAGAQDYILKQRWKSGQAPFVIKKYGSSGFIDAGPSVLEKKKTNGICFSLLAGDATPNFWLRRNFLRGDTPACRRSAGEQAVCRAIGIDMRLTVDLLRHCCVA
jgi:hypothetical protein